MAEQSDLVVRMFQVVTALAAIAAQVEERGEFGNLYDPARDNLWDFLSLFGQHATQTLASPNEENVRARTVCERDGAVLHVWGADIIHTADGKDTIVEDRHELDGPLCSIVVDGHTWTWPEMVDGVMRVFRELDGGNNWSIN